MNTAKNKVAINKIQNVLSCSLYGDVTILDDVRAEFEVLLAAQNAAVATLLEQLDAENNVNNYSLDTYYTEDWEKSIAKLDNSVSKWSVQTQGTINKMGIAQEKNGNKYLVHKYLEKQNPKGSYLQLSLASYNAEKGLVFEFDIATFGEIPEQGVQIETGSIDGSRFPPYYFYLDGNGNILSNDKSEVLLANALVKGAWLHVIIVLDPDEFVYKLYVEGEFLGQYDAKYNKLETFDHTKVAFRISGGPSTQGEIAFDNIKIYAGNNYRNPDRLNNMTDAEKFVYYVNYTLKETNPVVERTTAHTSAMSLINNYWVCTDEEAGTYEYTEAALESEEIQKAVQSIIAFDIDAVLAKAKLANLNTFIEKVKALSAVERSTSTTDKRESLIEDISTFTKKYMGLIDLESDIYPEGGNGVADYEELSALYNNIIQEVTYDKNAAQFIKYMNRFEKATTLSATQRYYDFAKLIVMGDGLDLNLIRNENAPHRDNFAALIAAYDVYLNSQVKVDAVTKENNSYKIVICMSKIEQYRTVEEWDANADLMKEYLYIVKDSVLGRDANGELLYDPSYEGIDDAIRFFNRAYAHFYALLQDEHVEYLNYVLELVAATDSYVEKVGMIALIERYIDTNDLDTSDARIKVILSNVDICKSELEARGEDYSKVLKQNSVYFVNLVENMRTAKSYAEQVAYYEAASVLYFSLDITVEGSAEAVEIFDQYKAKLDLIEESSVKFLQAVSLYNACEDKDEKYAALVECYYNAQFAELTYEGVAEAMTEYQAAYDAYVSYANAVNADLAETGNAVGSVRTTCGVTTVIAIIIKKIFGI